MQANGIQLMAFVDVLFRHAAARLPLTYRFTAVPAASCARRSGPRRRWLRNRASAVALLDIHHPPISAREAHRKASRLLRVSWGRPRPGPHGCVRTWCTAGSSAQILCVPRSCVEQSRGPGIADSGDALPRAASNLRVEFRSCLLPGDRAGAQHSQSPVKAADGQ